MSAATADRGGPDLLVLGGGGDQLLVSSVSRGSP
jgi:hypothetical protein